MATRYRRRLTPTLTKASRAFPVVVLTGPRRAGKTDLLRHAFPGASYALLEEPDVVARVRADPRSFLESLKRPVILDEIQNAPELLPYVRALVDASPRKTGQWLLTGSQEFSLMEGVTESMAGRAAILHLLPLSVAELGRYDLLRGGYPEVWRRPSARALWFRSYVQTYLERDVRAVTAVRDLATFRTFLSLLAAASGRILNRTELATPLGVSVPTVSQWISVLETTGVVLVVRPYFENFGKRLVKSPKVYFTDTGLLCHLLGLEDEAALARSPFLGPVFETFVASELLKQRVDAGLPRELHYFRDEQGLEVDFVVAQGDGLLLLEAKSSRTVRPADAKAIESLVRTMTKRGRRARGIVLHRGTAGTAGGALAPGVEAASVEAFFG